MLFISEWNDNAQIQFHIIYYTLFALKFTPTQCGVNQEHDIPYDKDGGNWKNNVDQQETSLFQI